MLTPKRVKYRKMQKGRMGGKAIKGCHVEFGAFGLQSTEPGRITAQQIEAARIAMTRHIKRGGRIWIRIYPHKSFTRKPAETRMGKGKGPPEGWVACVKPGTVMYELEGGTREVAREAFRLAAHKLPVGTKFVSRNLFDED